MKVGVLVPFGEHIADEIRKVHQMGFQNGQISTLTRERYHGMYNEAYFSDERAEKIRAVCEELDFEVTALFAGWSGYCNFAYPEMYWTVGFAPAYLREQRIADVLRGAEFAKKIHVKNVITHIGYLRDDPQDPERRDIMLSLRYIADCLAANGQCLQIETGEMIPVSLIRLIHDIDRENVGINFDPANLLINGRANPSDALDLLLPYVRGMHVKDGVYPQGTEPKGKETPIGEGRVDFAYIIGTLLKNGYQGTFTIEREIEGEEQKKDILRAGEYVREILQRV